MACQHRLKKKVVSANKLEIKTHSNKHKTEQQWTPSRRQQIRTSRIALSNALEYIEWHEIIEQTRNKMLIRKFYITDWGEYLVAVFNSVCFRILVQNLQFHFSVFYVVLFIKEAIDTFTLAFKYCSESIDGSYPHGTQLIQSQLITLFWGITLRLCKQQKKYTEYYLHSLTNSIDSMQHSLRTKKLRFAIGNVSIFKEDRDQNPLLFSSSLNVLSLCVYFVC